MGNSQPSRREFYGVGDKNLGQFILTGSSARKLRHNKNSNLLPGRVIQLHLDPMTLEGIPEPYPPIEDLLSVLN